MATRRPSRRPPPAPGGDLFGAAAAERLAQRAPLATRLRPRTLDDIVGQRHLVAPGAPLRVLIEADRLTSAILWGPAGTGKTTLAQVVATTTAKAFVPLSAVDAGVGDVRLALAEARRRLGEQGRGTILFVDEVHRFNKAQQDALLPAVEEGLVVLIGATTENPFFAVNSPLLSRATLWRLEPLADEELAAVVRRGLEAEGAGADDEAVALLVSLADGDARAALGTLEVALALGGEGPLTAAGVERARAGRLVHQGPDAHYDQVSALIKAVRGSDPDAGLYWLARMLEGGEDARFIARRLVILASEDVGLADPLALVVADAAARAVEFVGLPEAQLTLAEAVVYLAVAPKSNSVTAALGRARADVREGPRADVPSHLRDAHYWGARGLGHGEGYRYPHDDPRGWVEQDYRPPEVAGHVYYRPSRHGAEAEVAERLRPRPDDGDPPPHRSESPTEPSEP
ncbi:MAG TPA: replication-associated recombination protein A [Acidimicrobiales bacterium]|nr:replication-associated recombination protein A [Acidimicrobiales bacterium]